MSNDDDDKQRLAQLIEWAFRALLTGMVSLMLYGGKVLYEQQQHLSDQMDQRLRQLELWQSQTSANRFTSGDWMNERRSLDSAFALIDKRVTRTEESDLRIITDLSEINRKLDRLLKPAIQ